MNRSTWLASFPPSRRDGIVLAYHDAIYGGRETIARYVTGRGGGWAAMEIRK